MFNKKKADEYKVEFVKPEMQKVAKELNEQDKALLSLVEQFQIFNKVHSAASFDDLPLNAISAQEQNKLFAIWASVDFLRAEIVTMKQEQCALLQEIVNEIRAARLGEQSEQSEQSPAKIH